MDTFIAWLSSIPGIEYFVYFLLAVLALGLLAIIVMYVVAYCQGREITFWKLKIGAKPDKPHDVKATGPAGTTQGELVIHLAVYGRGTNVTEVTKKRLSEGKGKITVTNDLVAHLGGDPLPKVEKDLIVAYSHRGTEYVKAAHEYTDLSLP